MSSSICRILPWCSFPSLHCRVSFLYLRKVFYALSIYEDVQLYALITSAPTWISSVDAGFYTRDICFSSSSYLSLSSPFLSRYRSFAPLSLMTPSPSAWARDVTIWCMSRVYTKPIISFHSPTHAGGWGGEGPGQTYRCCRLWRENPSQLDQKVLCHSRFSGWRCHLRNVCYRNQLIGLHTSQPIIFLPSPSPSLSLNLATISVLFLPMA